MKTRQEKKERLGGVLRGAENQRERERGLKMDGGDSSVRSLKGKKRVVPLPIAILTGNGFGGLT